MENYQVLSTRIDKTVFWIVFANLIVATILLMYSPKTLEALLMEDYILENTGAICLMLTGIILMLTAYNMYRRGSEEKSLVWWRIFMLLAAGLVFMVAFAEEISWGQRIFQFQTPEAMQKLNRQNEINLHNLNTRMFNNAVETLVLLMILISTIWIHRGKDKLLGIVTPSFWLVLCLQMVAAYVSYNYVKTQDYTIFLVLLYFLIVCIRIKNWRKLWYVLAAIVAITIVGVVNANLRELHGKNGPREFRE